MRLVWIISKEIEIARSNVFLIFGHFKIHFYLNQKWSATWRYLLTTLLFEIASHHIRAWHCLILNLGWKKKTAQLHKGPEWPPIKENYLSHHLPPLITMIPSHWPRMTTYQGKLLVKWSPPSLPPPNLKFLFITSHALCGLLGFFLFFPKVIISQYVPTCL